MNAIAIDHLTKRYAASVAVDDVTLHVGEGSVCGLLGPNGAGKSTTLRCLLGLMRPTKGTVTALGGPVVAATFESLAYVPETSALYPWMSVADHLEITRRSYARYDEKRAHELAALFALDSRKKIKSLSKGQKTAVALVLAFAIRPRVLVLDEPSSGLDPVLQRAVLDLVIEAAANGATVLFSSHQIGQVERAADRAAILLAGRLVVDGEIDALKSDEKIVEAIYASEVPALDELARDPRVRRIERSGRVLRVSVSRDAPAIERLIAVTQPRAVQIVDLGLEDIFMNAVGAIAPQVGND